jgi:magnesium-transporting ATPase (P-type)
VRLQGKEETYDLLHILDFDNDRKRMSVSIEKKNLFFIIFGVLFSR